MVTASGGPFRAAAGPSWATSRRSRRSRIPPGRWARSSRSTPPRWSTRAWRSSRRTCSSASASTASTSSCTRSRWCTRWSSSPTGPRSPRPARRTCGCRSRSRSAGRTGCRRRAGDRLEPAHTWTFEPLDDGGVPGGGAGPRRRDRRRAPRRRSTTRPTRSASPRSWRAGIAFTGIVDTVARVVSEQTVPAGDAVTIEDVLAADDWARDRARELTGTGPRGVAGHRARDTGSRGYLRAPGNLRAERPPDEPACSAGSSSCRRCSSPSRCTRPVTSSPPRGSA